MSELDTTGLVIGEESQYFLDDGIVEAVHGLTRVVHSPQKVEANPLIQRDRPWEHVTYFSCNAWTLWRDQPSGRFQCLYTDWKLDRERLARAGGTIVDWDNARYRQCYARSDDGLAWEKPPMGFQLEEGQDTNIVFGSEDLGCVYELNVLDDPMGARPSAPLQGPLHPPSRRAV